jgi:hypothetical protein
VWRREGGRLLVEGRSVLDECMCWSVICFLPFFVITVY